MELIKGRTEAPSKRIELVYCLQMSSGDWYKGRYTFRMQPEDIVLVRRDAVVFDGQKWDTIIARVAGQANNNIFLGKWNDGVV